MSLLVLCSVRNLESTDAKSQSHASDKGRPWLEVCSQEIDDPSPEGVHRRRLPRAICLLCIETVLEARANAFPVNLDDFDRTQVLDVPEQSVSELDT